MKKLIIDYKRHYDKNGYIYDQTITLTNDFVKYINKIVRQYHKSSHEVKNITAECVGFSRYNENCLTELKAKDRIIFLNLTQLQLLYYYLSINNYCVDKIKVRNTIIKVV